MENCHCALHTLIECVPLRKGEDGLKALTVPFQSSCTMVMYNEHPAMEFTCHKCNNNGITAVGMQCREDRRALSLKQPAV